MKTEILTCDRCEAEVEKFKTVADMAWNKYMPILQIKVNCFTKDLCDDCFEELKKWCNNES